MGNIRICKNYKGGVRRMTIAIWIIAICEVIRMLQNILQLRLITHDNGARDDAYKAFIDSIKADDKEFVANLLREFEKENADGKICE